MEQSPERLPGNSGGCREHRPGYRKDDREQYRMQGTEHGTGYRKEVREQ